MDQRKIPNIYVVDILTVLECDEKVRETQRDSNKKKERNQHSTTNHNGNKSEEKQGENSNTNVITENIKMFNTNE